MREVSRSNEAETVEMYWSLPRSRSMPRPGAVVAELSGEYSHS